MKGKLFRSESPAGMIFGIASVLGLVFTIIYTLASIYKGSFDLSAISIIVSLGIVNSLLAVICIILTRDSYSLLGDKSNSDLSLFTTKNKINELTTKLETKNEILKGVAFHMHNILDQLRDRIAELTSFCDALLLDKDYIPEEADIIDVLRITKQFNIYLVNNVKDIFDYLTQDNCSVCIKIIDISEDDEFIVSTLMRDTRSFRERKANDGLYNEPFPWYENTAFKKILGNNVPDSFYVSDDLKNEQSYVNINCNWKNFYNATLVAPIRLNLSDLNHEEDMDANVIGFLCIDNFKGGFTSKASIEIMASIADSLYQYFNTTAKLLDQATLRIQESNASQA